MKTKALPFIFLLILFSISSYAQWTKQSPEIDHDGLQDISFLDGENGWIVSIQVYRSQDSGYHWKEQSAMLTQWKAIDFRDEKHGWICGIQGLFSRTDDGGNTWNKQILPGQYNLNSISQIDSMHGWITGNISQYPIWDNTILYSNDGGLSWQDRSLPDSTFLNNVSFLDTLHGWAKTEDLWQTMDGGQNWTKVRNSNDTIASAVQFLDAMHGWVSGDSLLYTSDGGQSWIDITPPSLPGNSIGSFEFIDTLIGFVMQRLNPASQVVIPWYTQDGGMTWDQLATPSGINLFSRSMDVSEDGRLWVVQNGGKVMTAMIGDSVLQHRASGPTDQYIDIQMFDTTSGYVLGLSGSFRHTINSGNLWKTDIIGGFLNLGAMSFPYPQKGWVAGSDGMVFSTRDGGQSWSSQQLAPSYEITDLVFTDSLHGWTYGFIQPFGPQLIMKTADGGMNWDTSFMNPKPHFSKLFFRDEDYGWATSNHGIIYYTTDGGELWDSTMVYEQFFMGDLFFLDANTGWLCGDSGRIYQSTDGGLHWSESTSGLTTKYLNDIAFADPLHGIAAGDNVALHTYDGGQSWFKLTLGGASIYSLSYPHPDVAWGCGGTQGIMRFDKFPVTGIAEELSTDKGLEIFPNPAKNNVTLRFKSSGQGEVRWSISNLQGKLLRTETIGSLSGDVLEFHPDIHDLVSGVYILTVEDGVKRVTTKFVKVESK